MSTSNTSAKNQRGKNAPVVLESECAAIGSAIRDSSAGGTELAETVLAELDETDFYSSKTQAAYKAIKGILDEGLTVNEVSVSERSGLTRSEIAEFVATAAGVSEPALRTLCSDIRRTSELRTIFYACTNAAGLVGKGSKPEDILDSLEKSLYRNESGGADSPRDGMEVLETVTKDFLLRQSTGGGVVVSTGLRDLDRALVGLRAGKMGVIAARPSMGKTALSSTIRRSVLGQGYGVIEFNLEMDKEEIAERELSYQAQMNLRKVLSAKDVSESELSRVRNVLKQEPAVYGRWYVDDRTYSIGGMRRKAKLIAGRMARSGIKVGLVSVDYLQLAGENGEGREQSVAAISRGIKLMAKELGCTVLALSQLNRSCEYREDRRPLMSDLRESGSIEQDADWVGFVYREHMYDSSFPPEETEFIIRKQRSGPTGTVRLKYNPKTVSFSDVDIPVPGLSMQNVHVQNVVSQNGANTNGSNQ